MASTFLGSQYIPVYCTSLPATSLPCSWPKIACRTLAVQSKVSVCYYDRVYNALLLVPLCNWSVSCRGYLLQHNCAHIHVNIFEHIGLPMCDVKKRSKRLYQMASSALSLPRNLLLDFSFGQSVICCHVEHHLFPQLSDNMCLKIKPVVYSYLKSNGLPYHEARYLSQLWKFYNNYAPPITELIGIQ